MSSFRHRLIGAGLAGFHGMGLHRLLAPKTRGRGAILTFHHVRPGPEHAFAPNRLLEVTPAFLDALLFHVKQAGYRLVALDDVLPLLASDDPQPFVVLTFDDGYRDLVQHALPVLERHDAPFATFVTTGFLDRTARLWWVELEVAIRRLAQVDVRIHNRVLRLRTQSPEQKERAFCRIAKALNGIDDATRLDRIAAIAQQADLVGRDLVAQLCLSWSDLEAVAAHPLATVGCHTITHPRLALLSADEARREIDGSRDRIVASIGKPVRHLCYPYGGRDAAASREFRLAEELHFVTAVTTRPGVLTPANTQHPTALPRITVNGLFQTTEAVDVLLSGAGFALWHVGRTLGLR